MKRVKNFFSESWQISKNTVRYLNEDEPIVYSAAIAFFAIFSLPAILIVISMVGSLFVTEKTVRTAIVRQADELINEEASEQVQSVLENVSDIPAGTWGTILGILLVVKSATIILFIIQKALNSIWRVKVRDKVNHLRVFIYRLLTFLLIAGLGLALVANILFDAVIVVFSEQLQDVLDEYLSPVIRISQRAFGALTALAVFMTMLKALPDARISWKDTLAGGIITTIFFLIGIQIIELILGKIKVAGIYTAAGSLVVVLLWVFYSALIFFLGAEITKAYAIYHGRKVDPSSIAIKYRKVTQEEK
jgi:membrane protein